MTKRRRNPLGGSVFRWCSYEESLTYFKPSAEHLKNPPLSPFFQGGIYRSREENVQVRSSRQLRFSVPLFGKEGQGEIFLGEANHFYCFEIFFLVGLLFAVTFAGCGQKGPPVSESEVKAVFEKTIPSSIDDKAWERVPLHSAKLLLQDMVEPRQLKASTPFVRVQAITDGQKLVFRLSWNDSTMDDLPGPGRFGDAVAVQLPAATTADVPAPQMGEEGKSVEITYWSAVLQAVVNGRKDDIQAIYPRAKVDHYPFEAVSLKPGSPAQQEMEKRYAPARSLGNPMAGPRSVPVQDLVAEGPGTLRPAEKAISSGTGKYDKAGWTVLLFRPLPNGAQLGGRTQVAFAVWEGSHEEVGARKMRTAWIPLALGSAQ
jgi:predicted small lipoprotein YifL